MADPVTNIENDIAIVAVIVLIGAACFGAGFMTHALTVKNRAAVVQTQAITHAAAQTNTIEKRIVHDQTATDAAVARAKAALRRHAASDTAPPVCPAAGGHDPAPVAPGVAAPDPDAEWRGYLRGIGSVLDSASHGPGASADSASGADGLHGADPG